MNELEQFAKDLANEVYNRHYMAIMENGSELSQEITISILAKMHAEITIDYLIDISLFPERFKKAKEYLKNI